MDVHGQEEGQLELQFCWPKTKEIDALMIAHSRPILTPRPLLPGMTFDAKDIERRERIQRVGSELAKDRTPRTEALRRSLAWHAQRLQDWRHAVREYQTAKGVSRRDEADLAACMARDGVRMLAADVERLVDALVKEEVAA